jgi:hypothetical protein
VHGWDGTEDGLGMYEEETLLVELFNALGNDVTKANKAACVTANVRHRVEADAGKP